MGHYLSNPYFILENTISRIGLRLSIIFLGDLKKLPLPSWMQAMN